MEYRLCICCQQIVSFTASVKHTHSLYSAQKYCSRALEKTCFWLHEWKAYFLGFFGLMEVGAVGLSHRWRPAEPPSNPWLRTYSQTLYVHKHSVSLPAFSNILVSIHKIRIIPASNLWSRYWRDLQVDRTMAGCSSSSCSTKRPGGSGSSSARSITGTSVAIQGQLETHKVKQNSLNPQAGQSQLATRWRSHIWVGERQRGRLLNCNPIEPLMFAVLGF